MQSAPGSPGPDATLPSRLMHHLRRASRADLTTPLADAAERQVLAQPSAARHAVTGAQAQDYLAWRRSLLWTSCFFLAVSAAIALVLYVVNLFEDTAEIEKFFNIGILKFLGLVQLVATIWLPIAAWHAVQRWDDLRASRRRLRRGWMIGFLVPFAVALVPIKALFLFEAPTTLEEAQGQAGILQLLGVVFGIMIFLQLVPSVLAIFVGAVRCALALKQFVPESALPGWVATVAAPVFAVVALAVFVLFHQIGGNWLLLAGFALIVANYLLLARAGPGLARPNTPEEARALLRPIRSRATILLSVGSLCLLVALFTIEFMGHKFVAFEDGMMNPFDLLQLVISVIGRSLFTVALFADLMMTLLRHAWRETQALQLSELGNVLESKIREMEETGIADLRPAQTRDPSALPP